MCLCELPASNKSRKNTERAHSRSRSPTIRILTIDRANSIRKVARQRNEVSPRSSNRAQNQPTQQQQQFFGSLQQPPTNFMAPTTLGKTSLTDHPPPAFLFPPQKAKLSATLTDLCLPENVQPISNPVLVRLKILTRKIIPLLQEWENSSGLNSFKINLNFPRHFYSFKKINQ